MAVSRLAWDRYFHATTRHDLSSLRALQRVVREHNDPSVLGEVEEMILTSDDYGTNQPIEGDWWTKPNSVFFPEKTESMEYRVQRSFLRPDQLSSEVRRRICDLHISGISNKTIAEIFMVTPRTVKVVYGEELEIRRRLAELADETD